jgi:hypothetical protein
MNIIVWELFIPKISKMIGDQFKVTLPKSVWVRTWGTVSFNSKSHILPKSVWLVFLDNSCEHTHKILLLETICEHEKLLSRDVTSNSCHLSLTIKTTIY